MTTTYPIKPPLYAITKTTNYLPNVLMQMEAKETGFDNGVFIDDDGHVGESSNMNVAFVSHDGVLVHPKFDHILSGCTSLRLLELAQKLVKSGQLKGVRSPTSRWRTRWRRGRCCSSAARSRSPASCSGTTHPIGNGKPGPIAAALLDAARRGHAHRRSADRCSVLM